MRTYHQVWIMTVLLLMMGVLLGVVLAARYRGHMSLQELDQLCVTARHLTGAAATEHLDVLVTRSSAVGMEEKQVQLVCGSTASSAQGR